jgi:hypothetical protein
VSTSEGCGDDVVGEEGEEALHYDVIDDVDEEDVDEDCYELRQAGKIVYRYPTFVILLLILPQPCQSTQYSYVHTDLFDHVLATPNLTYLLNITIKFRVYNLDKKRYLKTP